MADQQKQNLKALHDLVATENDAAEGYGKAAKGVHDRALSDRLAEISRERLRFATELTRQVAQLGGHPGTDLHEGGILHRGWVDLETRIRPKDQHDILQNCIDGDEGTLKHYGHVLSEQLPEELRAAVETQRAAVERDLAFLRESLHKHRAQHA